MSLGGACTSQVRLFFAFWHFIFARAIVNFSAGDVDLHIGYRENFHIYQLIWIWCGQPYVLRYAELCVCGKLNYVMCEV